MTNKEAINYLESLSNYEKEINYTYSPSNFNLDRVEKILLKLGNPHKSLKTIHIAGTKGKGSTSYLVASILKEAGFKVGLYTSPHIVCFTERIRILDKKSDTGGRLISDNEITNIVKKIKTVIDASYGDCFKSLTYFEILTCVGFYFFAEEKVDFAVIEVGMGGRLDATNVIIPLVSAITTISLDHTKELGNNLVLIAKEKAGIIKDNVPVVVSVQQEEVRKTIRDVCNKKNSFLYESGKDFTVKIKEVSNKGSVFSINTKNERFNDIHLTFLGEHQIINAAVAIQIVMLLKNTGVYILAESIRNALGNASFMGRLEVMQENPIVVLDGAHNEASAFCLKDALMKLFKYERLFLVVGMSMNKNIKAFADVLCPLAYEVILTKADSPRATDPDKLLNEGFNLYSDKVVCIQDVDEAVKYTLLKAGRNDLICFTGSFYILAEVKFFFADYR